MGNTHGENGGRSDAISGRGELEGGRNDGDPFHARDGRYRAAATECFDAHTDQADCRGYDVTIVPDTRNVSKRGSGVQTDSPASFADSRVTSPGPDREPLCISANTHMHRVPRIGCEPQVPRFPPSGSSVQSVVHPSLSSALRKPRLPVPRDSLPESVPAAPAHLAVRREVSPLIRVKNPSSIQLQPPLRQASLPPPPVQPRPLYSDSHSSVFQASGDDDDDQQRSYGGQWSRDQQGASDVFEYRNDRR